MSSSIRVIPFVITIMLFANTLFGQCSFYFTTKNNAWDTTIEVRNSRIGISRDYKKNPDFNPRIDPREYLPFPIFHNDIYFIADTFEYVDFKYSIFKSNSILSGLFTRGIELSRAIFEVDVSFSRSEFWDEARCNNVEFNGTADLSNTIFSNATFYKDTFKHFASFHTDTFRNINDYVDNFSECSFLDGVSFNKTQFNNHIQFNKSYINGLDMSDCSISKQLDLESTNIGSFLDLSHSNILDKGKISFDWAQLPPLINLSYCHSVNEIDLTLADIYNIADPNYCYLNLYNADLSKVVLDYEKFKLCFFDDNSLPNINILGNTYRIIGSDIYIKDKNINIKDTTQVMKAILADDVFVDYLCNIFPGIEFDKDESFCTTLFKSLLISNTFTGPIHRRSKLKAPIVMAFIRSCCAKKGFPKNFQRDRLYSLYEKELKNFSDQGQKNSYRILDIEYKNLVNYTFILPHIWNCYGYHKEWIFWWIAILIALYTTITTIFFRFLNEDIYHIDFHPNNSRSKWKLTLSTNNRDHNIYGARSNYVKKIWYAFLYTCIIFFLLTLKVENFNFDSKRSTKVGIFYIILVYVSGVACLAYMAGFVLQK